jgi:DNA mismatch endonuclease (patch repair protein)
MPDVHDAATRSRNMAAVRGKDTKPELLIRRGLHGLGFRYRLQAKDLPGRPDLVLPKHGAVIFIHGCFWHGHDCPLFRLPATRPGFWKNKIAGNVKRDAKALAALQALGWRTGTVWECALRGPARQETQAALKSVADWIRSEDRSFGLTGSMARANVSPLVLS